MGYVVSGTFLVAVAKQMPAIGASAELLWIVVGLAGVPSSPLWMRASQRWGAPAALIAAHLVQPAGIVLPVLFDALWVALVAAVCFGGMFMGITAVAVSCGGRISAQPARMIGLLTAAFGLGQMVGPVIAGWLAERQGGFDVALQRVLADEKFDVVHIHEPFAAFVPVQFLRFSEATNVATFHAAREGGGSRWYAVGDLEVVDSSRLELVIDPGLERLSLVTCYPFDSPLAGGALRYVVTAYPIRS